MLAGAAVHFHCGVLLEMPRWVPKVALERQWEVGPGMQEMGILESFGCVWDWRSWAWMGQRSTEARISVWGIGHCRYKGGESIRV